MVLRSALGSKNGILFISFNQDGSCIALGTQHGIKIYSRHTHSVCYEHLPGAIGVVEMLFCSSIVAYVGAGEQPALTPRRLTVLNTSSRKTIQDVHFTTSVLAVHMNRQRLVVVLESKAFVYNVANLNLLRTLELPPGSGRFASALSACDQPNLLALPATADTGTLRVYDLMFDGGNVLCEVSAHTSPLESLAWNHDGTLLASASNKGTVIRVHRMPHAIKMFTLRRGTRHALIHSLTFSPAGIEPPLLAASSSHGTVHLFRLQHDVEAGHGVYQGEAGSSSGLGRAMACAAASIATGLLTSVLTSVAKLNVADMVEPRRPILSIKLPCHPGPSTCILILAPELQQFSSSSAGGVGAGGAAAAATNDVGADQKLIKQQAGSGSGSVTVQDQQQQQQPSSSVGSGSSSSGSKAVDSVMLAVATLDGLLYEYHISDLLISNSSSNIRGGGLNRTTSGGGSSHQSGVVGSGPLTLSTAGPKAVLEGEWALQGSMMLQG
ncbi:hypothetical protein CEUSTIGMA_g1155.t1 [Chlamydomonas eustigma]|uniref:BCAS3 domain-containing protein n=1 Tax=Chlamydomonas eustigma TaxID=1157962 RepID=A0A250WS86_9CHLO|nr:hypothetical protein CEUSTIGMA_g1155.t1 [Chlamydomonas eustigma]|eukprot:GAX73703.1 hypothetical protein CEUSTIGMA_g1155.t1 [Chlamydomonas eustigma]